MATVRRGGHVGSVGPSQLSALPVTGNQELPRRLQVPAGISFWNVRKAGERRAESDGLPEAHPAATATAAAR